MEQWTEIHTELYEIMKREIENMRQLLANLHYEEVLIMRGDKTHWNQLMEERGKLILSLSDIRSNRTSITENLLATLGFSQNPKPLEELVPLNHENSAEILALRDQILALLDRMNLQTSRNEMLTQLQIHQKKLQPIEKKDKISIATLPPEEYEKGA